MGKHDVERLESYVEELRAIFDRLVVETDYQSLIQQWHKPGWTTPAEYLLVSGTLETMIQQAQTLERCKEIVFAGSQQITAAATKIGEPTAV
jgi:hypothetical protein